MLELEKYAISVVATVALLIIEAMVSCGTAALDNISESDMKKRAEEGDERAVRIVNVMCRMEKSKRFVLVLMTTLNLAIGFFYSRRIVHWSAVAAHITSDSQMVEILRNIFQLLGMIILIYIVVLLGNAIPQKVALKQSEKKADRYAKLLMCLLSVFQIFSIIIDKSVVVLFKISGRNLKDYEDNVTEEEIISIVNEGLEQGILEDNEVEMIANIIEMDEKEVRDIMTRRTKIVGLDGNMTVEEAMQFMMDKSYSRFPVYDGDIDNVIGIAFWKDITKYFIQNKDRSVPIRELAKKAYLVPDTQKIDVLFEEMQMKKIHMAIAIDEYGQTVGIVAMEDVLEEIVGNIFDEFDVDERMILKQRDGKYFMRGLAPLEEVAEELGIHMDEELEDYDTLNGFLISKLGHIPQEKEKINIWYKGYEFRVVDVKDRMIRFVRVHKEEES